MPAQLGVSHLQNLPVHAHRLDEPAGEQKPQRRRVPASGACLQRHRPRVPRPAGHVIEQTTPGAPAPPRPGDEELDPELAGPDLPPAAIADNELRRAGDHRDAAARRRRVLRPPPRRGEQKRHRQPVRRPRRTDEHSTGKDLIRAHSSDHLSRIQPRKPPRARRCPGGARTLSLLIRGHGQTVRNRPAVTAWWADIPGLSPSVDS